MAGEWVATGVSVERLFEKAAALTSLQVNAFIQPFVGKRIGAAGSVLTVNEIGESIHAVLFRGSDQGGVSCEFPRETPELMLVNKGDLLIVNGVIDYMTEDVLFLKHCRVLELTTVENARVKYGPDGRSKSEAAAITPEPKIEAADQSQPAETRDVRKPLPEAEARRFAELYLAIWKDGAIEGKALAAIRATYPDKAISRDPFYDIFRELRGPGKRGNPAFRGK